MRSDELWLIAMLHRDNLRLRHQLQRTARLRTDRMRKMVRR